jgi:peptide/nickel transport system permease protein
VKRPALLWLSLWALGALTAPFWALEPANRIDITQALLAPSFQHWFGTDALGRDLFLRVVAGSTVSLGIGFTAVVLATLIGAWLGAVAGYFGGLRDRTVLALIDLFLCFPAFFLILAVMVVVGGSVLNIVWILALTGWMGVARLVRAQALSLREREFVLAARALGAGDLRILGRHVVPNAMGPVRASAVLGASNAILAEAGLSFLGIGVQPPVPSWGNLLMDGKAVLGVGWWMMVFPGAAIFLTVFFLNSLGEALSHARRTAS